MHIGESEPDAGLCLCGRCERGPMETLAGLFGRFVDERNTLLMVK